MKSLFCPVKTTLLESILMNKVLSHEVSSATVVLEQQSNNKSIMELFNIVCQNHDLELTFFLRGIFIRHNHKANMY